MRIADKVRIGMVFGIGTGSGFQLQQLDIGLLSGFYEARTALRLGSSAIALARPDDPGLITPWSTEPDDRSLERQVNEIQRTLKFINPDSVEAKRAGDNKDAKALFTLYQALAKLKVVADYSAQSSLTDSRRSPLDILMQNGLNEIREFIATSALDKLDLLAGTKSNRIETAIGLGRDQGKLVGQVIQKKAKDDPIAGITGSEVFTVTINKSGVQEDIAIDLADIAGPITMNALVAHVNGKLAAIQAVDANGDPLFDDDGDPVARYTSRLTIEGDAQAGFALAFTGLTGEKVSLSAAAAQPSLFIVGTARPVNGVSAATLTRLDGVTGSEPATGYAATFSGTGAGIKQVPEDTEKTDLLNGRSNAVVEKIRASVSDLFKEMGIEKNSGDGLTRPAVDTTAAKVAVDSQGHMFVIGTTQGDVGREINRADGGDVYLSKYDAAGNVVWQHLLGASGSAEGFSLAVDSSDNVIVAGGVDGTLTGKELFKGRDSFATKFSNDGEQLWLRQLDTAAQDTAFAVTVDAADNVYIAGSVSGRIVSSASYGGGVDAYVARLDGATGSVAALGQFGGAGNDSVKAMSVAADGDILVAAEEDGRAVLRKLDHNDLSTVLWSVDLGALSAGAITGMAVEGGAIYVAGYSDSAAFGAGSVGAAHSGSQDGFVLRVDDSGGSAAAAWTSFLGSAGGDYVQDIAVSAGQVYVAGRTSGQLGDDAKTGTTDSFAARIDGGDGSRAWVEQFGTAGQNAATGLAFSASGDSVLTALGLGSGAIQASQKRDVTTQTTARAGDHFYISINGRAQQRITIQDGDTFEKIASRINRLSLTSIKAEVLFSSEGRKLKVSSKNEGEIQIIAGDGDRDALPSLGLEPAKILPSGKLFGLDKDTEDDGNVFALELEAGLSVADERAAKYVTKTLENALRNLERAYRALFPNPLAEMLKQQSQAASGPVPPHLQKQLANYMAGYNRLMAGGGVMI